ncbi:DsbA family protein [Solirubrobacter soli]|uniref:DsbA family protein n=1 Tax=Solirubrobacter soli TaxID=363832 RepID=UPI00041915C0|nr:thioredoxin domain-containing protein [Solirubrobacter soli]
MSKSKRELREQRRQAERAAVAAESRRRRIRNLLGAAGLAVVLVVAGIAISANGGAKAKPVAHSSAAKLVAGIPEKDGVLGNPNAPITVTEYLDPQCPICAEASKANLPDLINKYVRTGKVKLQARTLSFIGPDSITAAKWAHGAEQQGKLWAFLETLYASQGQENSGYVTDDFLTGVAKAAGVDPDKAKAFADGASAQAALDQADGDAQALKVDSTPTFTVTKKGEKETVAAVGLDNLTANLDKALS